MANFDDTNYLLEGLTKKAIPADFAGEIPDIWTSASADDGSFLERSMDPFAPIRDEIQEHTDEGFDIEDALLEEANDIIDMKDLLDTTAKIAAIVKLTDPSDYSMYEGELNVGDKVASGSDELGMFEAAIVTGIRQSEPGWFVADLETEDGEVLTGISTNHLMKSKTAVLSGKAEDVAEEAEARREAPKPTHLEEPVKERPDYGVKLSVVERRGDKWVVLTKDRGRTLGTHDTKEKASAQLAAIETSKHGKTAQADIPDEGPILPPSAPTQGQSALQVWFEDNPTQGDVMIQSEKGEYEVHTPDPQGNAVVIPIEIQKTRGEPGQENLDSWLPELGSWEIQKQGALKTAIGKRALMKEIDKLTDKGLSNRQIQAELAAKHGLGYNETEPYLNYPDRLGTEASRKTAMDEYAGRANVMGEDYVSDAMGYARDLKQEVLEHKNDGESLRKEVGDAAQETSTMIDTFKGEAKVNRGDTFHNRMKRLAQDEEERVYSHELRVLEVKKGDQVMTPNGLGEVVDMWDNDESVMVRLEPDGDLRSYRVNRLQKTEARRKTAAGEGFRSFPTDVWKRDGESQESMEKYFGSMPSPMFPDGEYEDRRNGIIYDISWEEDPEGYMAALSETESGSANMVLVGEDDPTEEVPAGIDPEVLSQLTAGDPIESRRKKTAEQFKAGDVVTLKIEYGKRGVIQQSDAYGHFWVMWMNGKRQRVNPDLLERVAQLKLAQELEEDLAPMETPEDTPAEDMADVLEDVNEDEGDTVIIIADADELGDLLQDLLGDEMTPGDAAAVDAGMSGEDYTPEMLDEMEDAGL